MRQRTAAAEKTDARRRFQRYKPENSRLVREAKIKQSKGYGVLKSLLKVSKKIGEEVAKEYHEEEHNAEFYRRILDLVKGVKFDQQDIQTLLIRDSEDSDLGLLISALINNSDMEEFALPTGGLKSTPTDLGYCNRKNLIIMGNSGEAFGSNMEGGTVIIHGDGHSEVAGGGICYGMKGGKVLVKGNVGDMTGQGMEDGEIIIEGDAYLWLGSGMEGGRIVVMGHGGVALGSFMKGGEIICECDVGEGLGQGMARGKIVVKGNAGDEAAEGMKGGLVIIEGNAGDWLGNSNLEERKEVKMKSCPMKGGKIVVKGNAGRFVGEGILGGEIHLEGGYISLGTPVHGKIYHKGKLIVDK